MRVCAQDFQDFDTDALVVMQSATQVIGNTFVDTCAATNPTIAAAAHRDAVQLIPPSIYFNREQFAAGELAGVSVLGNRIQSTGKLQGIFGSDGLFQNLRIIGNTVQTKGQHFISINGMLSGWIEGNIKPDGTHCPIFLGSLRLCGNLKAGGVRVLSFSGNRYTYTALESIVDQNTLTAGVVVDTRNKALLNTKDIHLVNFDVDGFKAAAQKLPSISNLEEQMQAFKSLALEWGDLYGQK